MRVVLPVIQGKEQIVANAAFVLSREECEGSMASFMFHTRLEDCIAHIKLLLDEQGIDVTTLWADKVTDETAN